MLDLEALPRSNDRHPSGTLERVRRVARHLPIGPGEDIAPGEAQPPGAREGARHATSRVVVRPT